MLLGELFIYYRTHSEKCYRNARNRKNSVTQIFPIKKQLILDNLKTRTKKLLDIRVAKNTTVTNLSDKEK